MSKKIFSIKTLLASLAAVCVSLAVGGLNRVEASATDIPAGYPAKVNGVETLNGGAQLMFHLAYEDGYTTDYMTTAWEAGNNATYHWYLTDPTFGMPEEDKAKYNAQNGQLAYEDRDKYNMPNALLDKNLDMFNFAENILIDGVALGEYQYNLYANRWTYVHSLSIELTDPSVAKNATQLEIKAGCTLPSLYNAYFGKDDYLPLTIEEDMYFTAKNGVWTRTYKFDGYEEGVRYDACEKYVYTRAFGSTLEGHPEAVSYSYTDVFSVNGWGDDGFAVATTPETLKGSVAVFDLVNPIDTKQFGLLEVYLFSNSPRNFASHNAYEVTTESLGLPVEHFSIPGRTFTKITMFAPLYANEDGMIDRLVFEFTNERTFDDTQDQFFFGSFIVRRNNISGLLYDQSLNIAQTEDQYEIILRFNKQGAFNGDEPVDESKVILNGASIADINKNGQFATVSWAAFAGIYQLNITLDKAYTGLGQFVNPDLGYAGSKVAVAEGLVFPNGDVLDSTYACNIYAGETLIDKEYFKSYKDTTVTSATLNVVEREANNLKFKVYFDQELCSQPYVHACDRESWREGALTEIGYYDKVMSNLFVSGGFKSSLLDNILINGKSLGELHAEDEYNTCVFVHCGQMFETEILNISVDSNSATYQWLKPLYDSGEGITIEIKAGMKFPSGVKLTEDAKYILKDGALVRETNEEVFIYYDGKAVENGCVIKTNVEALESSVCVIGTNEYTITKTLDGDVVTFTVEFGGNTVTFTVEQTVVDMDPIDKEVSVEEDSSSAQGGINLGPIAALGCGSVVSGGVAGGVALIALGAAAWIRRKRDEENK